MIADLLLAPEDLEGISFENWLCKRGVFLAKHPVYTVVAERFILELHVVVEEI